jgi:branched-chain amino acid transport system ATP-binding protein
MSGDSSSSPSASGTSATAETTLAIADVTAGYGPVSVLKDVSLRVGSGQITALLGPNGAGKTTLLKTVAGLIRPRSGQISLGGERIDALAPHRRVGKGLCFIPEGRGIFRTLSVRDNLRMQVPPGQSQSAQALDRALTAFPPLRDRLDVAAGNLSGGQQQMLALARAYVSGPRMIMVDEASMGLAPLVVDAIFDALTMLARSGVAMLIVEQYVTRALALADQVVLLNKGTVTYSGPKSGLEEGSIWSSYIGVEHAGQPPSGSPRGPEGM